MTNSQGTQFGRPTKYRPEFCARAIELGKKGKSLAQIAKDFNVIRDTLRDWAAVNPDFSCALMRAREYSLAWWEAKGQAGINKGTSSFNAALYGKVMAARFPDDYRETSRTELTGRNGTPIAHTQMSTSEFADLAREIADRV